MEKELGHPLRDGLSSQAMEPQASPPKASIPDALHPEYGECDGFGPKGECSECTGLVEQEDGTIIEFRTGKVVRSIVPQLPEAPESK